MITKSRGNLPLYIMMLPAVILLIIYTYIPMLGIIIAFQNYKMPLGFLHSEFVGFNNFITLFNTPGFLQSLYNTVFIAILKIVSHLVIPVVFSLLLNEVRVMYYKRSIQTIIYLPFFVSWVLMAGIIIDILSPSGGIVNRFLGLLGMEPVFFLGNSAMFPYIVVVTNVWKTFGWDTIIYMAALTGINPTLYEAAVVDGAGRWKQTLHVTIPGIVPTVLLMTLLSLGNVLNAGFDQIYNLVSASTLETGDIIDTLVYRLGIQNGQFSIATAAGLFKSAISCFMMVISYKLAYRLTGYKII